MVRRARSSLVMPRIEKTSESHPIRVDFLPPEARLGPGRVGLTFAPGKQAEGIDGLWRRDLETDLARLRSEYRADLLVSLCEPHELAEMKIANLYDRARAHGIEVAPYPCVDQGVPLSPALVAPLVDRIQHTSAEGRVVVIHCRGGLGRSGTIAACAITARGIGPDEAMWMVRVARKGAIENARQEEFVHEFSAWHVFTHGLTTPEDQS